MTEKQNIKLMETIIKYCAERELITDTTFYTNGKKFSKDKPNSGFYITHKTDKFEYYELGNCDVTKQLEYCNPDTLTITFEGPLYNEYNGYGRNLWSVEEDITKIAEKFGLYPEQGYAWSLAFYKI